MLLPIQIQHNLEGKCGSLSGHLKLLFFREPLQILEEQLIVVV